MQPPRPPGEVAHNEDGHSLQNNRGNNRRRGRNNNRNQGNPNQSNRIDNRARGNAPQLLDKYKKLAHDASMNGDRVQAEYYLQFADHYHRVIADNKARVDEARSKRDDNRGPNDDDDDNDGDSNDRRQRNTNRRSRDDGNDNGGERGGDRPDADERQEKRPRKTRRKEQDDDSSDGYAPEENPFTRDERKSAAKPNGRSRTNGRAKKGEGEEGQEGPAIDVAALPPAISTGDESNAKPARKPRARRKPSADEAGEAA